MLIDGEQFLSFTTEAPRHYLNSFQAMIGCRFAVRAFNATLAGSKAKATKVIADEFISTLQNASVRRWRDEE